MPITTARIPFSLIYRAGADARFVLMGQRKVKAKTEGNVDISHCYYSNRTMDVYQYNNYNYSQYFNIVITNLSRAAVRVSTVVSDGIRPAD